MSEKELADKADQELPEEQQKSQKVLPDGGTKAWVTVLGVWFVLFASFGYVYSFGVYQDYYTRFYLSNHSASKISWIGSLQLMLPFLFGLVSGKLFDAGYFHALQLVGGVILIVSLFGLSLAKPQKYNQVLLGQGIGIGVGIGIVFVPSLSVLSHYFRRRKAWATGVAMTGVSVGAIVFPISANLLPSIGFAKTVRATGYVVIGMLVMGNLLMRSSPPLNPGGKPKVDIKSIFTDPSYLFGVAGAFLSLFGFYFPLIYIQLYAEEHGIDKNLAFYSIAIMNACGIPGRLTANYFADIYGSWNIFILATILTSASIFSIFGVHNSGSLIVVSIFYGWFSGAWLSLCVAALASSARHPHEVGSDFRVRTGLGLAIGSFATLGSAPIQGHLLGSTFIWSRPIVFSGVSVAFFNSLKI
ncbi:major facilitator superfamily domain-containing protein [Flammula alnicola]|nr:major facilitator superfamily domain-containing protein [Flammula alnicola]